MANRRKQTRKSGRKRRRMEETTSSFDPDLIRAIFKNVWAKRNLERAKNDDVDPMDCDVVVPGPSTSKKNPISSVNSNALKLTCELIRVFVSEAVQRAATIAEAEGGSKIEATHLERILPQFLLDFQAFVIIDFRFQDFELLSLNADNSIAHLC